MTIQVSEYIKRFISYYAIHLFIYLNSIFLCNVLKKISLFELNFYLN